MVQRYDRHLFPYYHGRNHDKPLSLVDVPVMVAVPWG